MLAIVGPQHEICSDPDPDHSGSECDLTYFDPFQSDAEMPIENLRARLRLVGANDSSHSAFLEPSPTSEIVLRAARNILASVQEEHRHLLAHYGGQTRASPGPTFPDLEAAFYGALWASLLLGTLNPSDRPALTQGRNYLPPFIQQFESQYPFDAGLIEAHVVPLFSNVAESARLQESVRVVRSADTVPKRVKHRSSGVSQRVHYRVGEIFVHRRYGYTAVITGWDPECGADEQWMAEMRVNELSQGKYQSFYHVLCVQLHRLRPGTANVMASVEDRSMRYVAQENIEILRPDNPPDALMRLAGKFFKRWDSKASCFISNILDEYPSD